MNLQPFAESNVKLSHHDAFAVRRFFWLEPGLLPQRSTPQDRTFNQALLAEAIGRSYERGFVEFIFRTFYGTVPVSSAAIRGRVKPFAKAAAKHCFNHVTGKDLESPRNYESDRRKIAVKLCSVWHIHLQIEEMTH